MVTVPVPGWARLCPPAPEAVWPSLATDYTRTGTGTGISSIIFCLLLSDTFRRFLLYLIWELQV